METQEAALRSGALLTVAFVVAAILAAVAPVLAIPFAVLSSLLFVAGCGLFIAAFVKALARSRTEEVSVAGVFGLATAPQPIRRRFHLLTAVQLVVAIATAAIRPFTAQAFGILVPMFGLGLGGWWAAQHATFSARPLRKGRNV